MMKQKSRISLPVTASIALIALLLGFAAGRLLSGKGGNFKDEMKLPYTSDFDDEGAKDQERELDHADSPYFYAADFYSGNATDTLTILPHFKTIQQTSWWSCGVCATEMVLNYYGRLGDWNEETLAALRDDHSDLHLGTCIPQIEQMFSAVGSFELETTYDYLNRLDEIDLSFIRQRIEEGVPIIAGWIDWGGHWQVIIGYDDMGTESEGDDVIIVADSFDTTDHNQDGYGVYSAERFMSEYSFYDFFDGEEGHPSQRCFVCARPVP